MALSTYLLKYHNNIRFFLFQNGDDNPLSILQNFLNTLLLDSYNTSFLYNSHISVTNRDTDPSVFGMLTPWCKIQVTQR